MIKIFFPILLVAVFTLSCCKEDLNKDLTQPVLFEFEYVNHAWGYDHLGWMIDKEGKVKGYNLPEKWNQPDEDSFLSKDELVENLAQTDTTYFTVDNSNLLNYFEDRYDLQGAKMDTSDLFMADAGIGALYVYVWDTSFEKYSRVLLATRGDISVSNKSPKANQLINWLETVGRQTDRFYWFDNLNSGKPGLSLRSSNL